MRSWSTTIAVVRPSSRSTSGPRERRHEALHERAVGLVDHPLRLGGDGAEHERALARAGHAGEHGQPPLRQVDVDVPQVVRAGAAHPDAVVAVGGAPACWRPCGSGGVTGTVVHVDQAYRRSTGPRRRHGTPLDSTVTTAVTPRALARWWRETLACATRLRRPRTATSPSSHRASRRRPRAEPTATRAPCRMERVFAPVPEEKTVKNRTAPRPSAPCARRSLPEAVDGTRGARCAHAPTSGSRTALGRPHDPGSTVLVLSRGSEPPHQVGQLGGSNGLVGGVEFVGGPPPRRRGCRRARRRSTPRPTARSRGVRTT